MCIRDSPDPCAQHFAALRRPELSPALQPQQLLGAVHHERHLNLIVELESEFGVEFDPEEISGMKCFEDIERVLTQKL